MKKEEFLNYIYRQICDKFNTLYSDYLTTNQLQSNKTFGLPDPVGIDVCKNLTRIIQMNQVQNVDILRLNFDSELMSLRAKHLYNPDLNESYIYLSDFSLNKIWLRSGGLGGRIINKLIDAQNIWLKEMYNTELPTKITIMKPLSLPFQFKNDFQFKQLTGDDQIDNSNWNITYKVSKLLIIMNKHQNIHQYIRNFNLFSADINSLNRLLSTWITSYYIKLYNESYWIKTKIIENIGRELIEDCAGGSTEFCPTMIYKNICHQLAQDDLVEMGITNILQNLFYLERISYPNSKYIDEYDA